MEHLYVCLFSNGYIKVGRSTEPKSRIAAHAERVACLGVELSDHATVECSGPAAPREAWLIERCADSATRRFQSEWFQGLEFLTVCDWARLAATVVPAASLPTQDGFGSRLREARISAGLTQSALGKGMGANGTDLLKAAVSSWEQDRNSPNVNQLRLLCERLNRSATWFLFGNEADQIPAPIAANTGESSSLPGAASCPPA